MNSLLAHEDRIFMTYEKVGEKALSERAFFNRMGANNCSSSGGGCSQGRDNSGKCNRKLLCIAMVLD